MRNVSQSFIDQPEIKQMMHDAANWNTLLDWYDRDVSDADIMLVVSEAAHERRSQQSRETER